MQTLSNFSCVYGHDHEKQEGEEGGGEGRGMLSGYKAVLKGKSSQCHKDQNIVPQIRRWVYLLTSAPPTSIRALRAVERSSGKFIRFS